MGLVILGILIGFGLGWLGSFAFDRTFGKDTVSNPKYQETNVANIFISAEEEKEMEKNANEIVDLLDEVQDSLVTTTGFEWDIEDTDDSWRLLAQDETEQRVIISINKKEPNAVWPIDDDADFIVNMKNYFTDALIAKLDDAIVSNDRIITTIDSFLKFKKPDSDVVSLLSKIKKFLLLKSE